MVRRRSYDYSKLERKAKLIIEDIIESAYKFKERIIDDSDNPTVKAGLLALILIVLLCSGVGFGGIIILGILCSLLRYV